jgi:magnesium transporter
MASFSRADLDRVSGPDSMAFPNSPRVESSQSGPQNTSANVAGGDQPPRKKKQHRAGKKHKRNRRQSFAAPPSETMDAEGMEHERPSLLDVANPRESVHHASLYRIRAGNRSNTSLESEALLDHRPHQELLSRRRQSIHRSQPLPARHRGSQALGSTSSFMGTGRSKPARGSEDHASEDEETDANDRTPLLGVPASASSGRTPSKPKLSRNNSLGYGSHGTFPKPRRLSKTSTVSSKRSRKIGSRGRSQVAVESVDSDYDVNNPPSVPGSPSGMGSLDDVMIAQLSASHASQDRGRDAIITIDDDDDADGRWNKSPSPLRRRGTITEDAQRDVCYPADAAMSEIAEEDDVFSEKHSTRAASRRLRRRNRHESFPKLWHLDEWAAMEKELNYQRAKKISEPMLIEGRLRPGQRKWRNVEEESPFRWTYFNEVFDESIHAPTISALLEDGNTFKDLFLPDPFETSDSEDEEGEDDGHGMFKKPATSHQPQNGRLSPDQHAHAHSAHQSMDAVASGSKRSPSASGVDTGGSTPAVRSGSGTPRPHGERHVHADNNKKDDGRPDRPVWWLDVLSPTEEEVRLLSRAFGIHQLTVEDIDMSEEREKVELFQTYYFVNYRSFEQDINSDNYLKPVNIYACVFRDFVITFHHTMTPHMNNVRRRIRHLQDYMRPNPDWIGYAIIDDITDAYAPLVFQIEQEVDTIDEEILYLHQHSVNDALSPDAQHIMKKKQKNSSSFNVASIAKNKVKGLFGYRNTSSSEKGEATPTTQADMGAQKADGEKTAGESGGDMLRRVGECRKRVMSLYRLLGNKADVIKGFAKRCNEHWQVAPKSEIGLYLGDIQDHIVTMTGNLSHYEK